jgi:hypothetical protein
MKTNVYKSLKVALILLLVVQSTACLPNFIKQVWEHPTERIAESPKIASTEQALLATANSLSATLTALPPESQALSASPTITQKTQPAETVAESTATTAPDLGFPNQFSFLNQIGGVSYALEVQGNMAYLGVGPRLYLLDITDPASPKKISQSPEVGAAILDIVVNGNLVYLSTMINLSVVDLTEPAQPKLVTQIIPAKLKLPLSYWIVQSGTMLYGFWSNKLGIYDLSLPSQPSPAGEYTLDWEVMEVVPVSRDNTPYLYIAGEGGHFQVLDITQPLVPKLVGETIVEFLEESQEPHPSLNMISAVGNFAYITSWNNGFLVMDVTDLTSPRQRGIYTVTPQEDAVVSDGKYAYLADDLIGLRVMDVTNPDQLVEISDVAYDLAGKCVAGLGDHRGISLRDGKVYVASLNQGMAVFNVAKAQKPKLLGSYTAPAPGEISRLIQVDHWLYALGDKVGLRLLDISDPGNPIETGFVDSSNNIGWRTPTDLSLYQNYIYVADINHGFFINNISDAYQPRQVNAYYTYDWKPRKKVVGQLSIAGSTLYLPICNYYSNSSDTQGSQAGGQIAQSECQLSIMDLVNPGAPNIVKEMDLPFSAESILASEEYLYLVGAENLLIMDIRDPFTPNQLSNSKLPVERFFSSRLHLNGNLLYMGSPIGNTIVMDITDPVNPVEFKFADSPMWMAMHDLDILDNHLFANLGYLIDVSKPPEITMLGFAPIWNCWGVSVEGDQEVPFLAAYACLDQGIRYFQVK